jgi:hypothetical protein
MWDRIQNGKEIFAYVKNKTKTGKFYWVHAYVTPVFEIGTKNIIGYHSVRRSPSRKGIEVIEPIYKQMLDAERNGGMEASIKLLNEILATQKVTYDKFILSFE